jgi:hypothetical protein
MFRDDSPVAKQKPATNRVTNRGGGGGDKLSMPDFSRVNIKHTSNRNTTAPSTTTSTASSAVVEEKKFTGDNRLGLGVDFTSSAAFGLPPKSSTSSSVLDGLLGESDTDLQAKHFDGDLFQAEQKLDVEQKREDEALMKNMRGAGQAKRVDLFRTAGQDEHEEANKRVDDLMVSSIIERDTSTADADALFGNSSVRQNRAGGGGAGHSDEVLKGNALLEDSGADLIARMEAATLGREKTAEINLAPAPANGGGGDGGGRFGTAAAAAAAGPAPAPAADTAAAEDDLFSMISSKQSGTDAGGGAASVFDFNNYIADQGASADGGLFD